VVTRLWLAADKDGDHSRTGGGKETLRDQEAFPGACSRLPALSSPMLVSWRILAIALIGQSFGSLQ
jgi:hypothetical protein